MLMLQQRLNIEEKLIEIVHVGFTVLKTLLK